MGFENIPELLYKYDYYSPPCRSIDFRVSPRPYASAAFVVYGSGIYFTEMSQFRLSPGDILFIPVGGTYHANWDDEPSDLIGFHFNMKKNLDRRYLVQKISGHSELADCFREAVADGTGELRACELFYHVLDTFWDELQTVETNIDPKIRPALDFLELSPERECSINDLARLCHMSDSHFFSCFKRSMGRAPMEYRTDLLIMNAQRLLASSELSISEVADRLGFTSETYFRRVFKAKVGVSPRDFRKEPMK